MLAIAFGVDPDSSTFINSTSAGGRITSLSDGLLRWFTLPTSTDNFYYKCYGKKQIEFDDFEYPITDLSTGATVLDVAIERNPPSNITSSCSRAEIAAILAAIGAIFSSFLF